MDKFYCTFHYVWGHPIISIMLNRVTPCNLDGTRPPTYPHPPLYDARTHALVYMMFHTNNNIPLGILYPPLYIHSKKLMCVIVWDRLAISSADVGH